MTRGPRIRATVALAAALTFAVALPAVTFAGGGNSAAAHRCQMGGWQTLEDASGHVFASQSACVSYAANGGAIFSPVLTVTDTSTHPAFAGSYAWVDFEGRGFHPNSTITLVTALDADGQAYTALVYPTTDGTGAWSLTPVGLFCTGMGYAAGGTITGWVSATDSEGVTVRTNVTTTCSS